MLDHENTVYSYHDDTKHHFQRYARSPGFMDWATQPDPFRRFPGAPVTPLRRAAATDRDPAWDDLFRPGAVPAAAYGLAALGDLLYHSLALSAWKEVRGPGGEVASRWSLRVNPSSGNLHPTEAYVIDGDGVFHYAPDEHLLEQRGAWDDGQRDAVRAALPEGGCLIALTSIFWRESWKYGERAFRYCQHDAGHALAALALAAARLGWRTRRLHGVRLAGLEQVLGVDVQSGPEKEHAEMLVAVGPAVTGPAAPPPMLPAPRILPCDPNVLSGGHRDWSVIERIAAAVNAAPEDPAPEAPAAAPHDPVASGGATAADLIRRRRSAVAMDGRTALARDAFWRLLRRLLPSAGHPALQALNAPAEVALALFVHRVDGLAPGLYLLCRAPGHEADLRAHLRREWRWERPAGCPDDLPLILLAEGDLREGAAQVSCGQAIAGAGAFSLGMLARFDAVLRRHGPAAYPRLFHETGAIGQMLYLEAEAAGLRGTGIGCFFDDEVHRVLGLEDHAWQSLYHFTVGGALEDPRLQTAPAYPEAETNPPL
jgi:SagB-type dehydrogenase family enzyme